MRKGFFFIIALSFVSLLNAQTFIGGSIGYNQQDGKQTTKVETTTTEIKDNTITDFTLAPMIGYSINKDFAIGFEFAYSSKVDNDNKTNPTIKTTETWAVSPFARYYFYNIRKFSVYGQANFNAGGIQQNVKIGDQTNTDPAASYLGVTIFPALQYNLSERVGLYANLNFLNIGYTSLTTTAKSTSNVKETHTSNQFNFGVNTSDLLNTQEFQIGFYINL